jgi:hypothetical protein
MIPLGALAAELVRRLPLAAVAKDLPRGRKRPGWKREFLKTLSDASADLKGVSEKHVLDAIRKVRSRRNKPELRNRHVDQAEMDTGKNSVLGRRRSGGSRSGRCRRSRRIILSPHIGLWAF